MKNGFRKVTFLFSSGSFGGLVNSLTVWIFGMLGITAVFSVNIAPALTKSWLYPRIVWGGLWGFLFLLPFLRHSNLLRGLLYSLGPTVAQLFIVFPIQAGKGVMGFDLGIMTPIFVLFFNAVWGVSTAWWMKIIEENPENVMRSPKNP